jgi:hypothetical protein
VPSRYKVPEAQAAITNEMEEKGSRHTHGNYINQEWADTERFGGYYPINI